jgi:hypothetical protein
MWMTPLHIVLDANQCHAILIHKASSKATIFAARQR